MTGLKNPSLRGKIIRYANAMHTINITNAMSKKPAKNARKKTEHYFAQSFIMVAKVGSCLTASAVKM